MFNYVLIPGHLILKKINMLRKKDGKWVLFKYFGIPDNI